MTVILVKQTIRSFLQTPTPQVMCIRGKWGVGKTFVWNEVLQEMMKMGDIKLPYSSYVSLFGLQSIDEVRQAVFENAVPTTKGEVSPTIESLTDNIQRFIRASSQKIVTISQYGTLPILNRYVTNFAGGFRQIISLAVKKTVVCFDDFERKKIPTKDLLGLISQLRDQRECKAVIILNENALSDDERAEFNRFFEKVLDIQITFAPTFSECAAISVPETDFVSEYIRENAIKLGISNIRIIYRIKEFSKNLIQIIDNFSNDVKRQALYTLTLTVWSKYSDEAIPMKNILDREGRMKILMGIGERSDEDKFWDRKLQDYKFSELDEFDLAIKNGVEMGFFDDQEIQKQATLQDNRFIERESRQAIEKSWRMFHDGFDSTNVTEIIETIYNTYKSNMKYVSQGNLDDLLVIFNELGFYDKASELIDHFVKVHLESIQEFSEYSSPLNNKIVDEQFRVALAVIKNPPSVKSLRQIFIDIYKGNENHESIERACASSVDDLYSLFNEVNGEDFYPVVEGSLFFRRVINATDRQKILTKNAIEALERIGKESAINAIRVRKFGVEINRSGTPDS